MINNSQPNCPSNNVHSGCTTTIAINPNFPHPLRYAAISGGYNVIGLVLVSLLTVAIS